MGSSPIYRISRVGHSARPRVPDPIDTVYKQPPPLIINRIYRVPLFSPPFPHSPLSLLSPFPFPPCLPFPLGFQLSTFCLLPLSLFPTYPFPPFPPFPRLFPIFRRFPFSSFPLSPFPFDFWGGQWCPRWGGKKRQEAPVRPRVGRSQNRCYPGESSLPTAPGLLYTLHGAKQSGNDGPRVCHCRFDGLWLC